MEAKFRLLLQGEQSTSNATSLGNCLLIDISPGGAKFFSPYRIPIGQKNMKVELNFTLFKTPMEVAGTLIWKKESPDGFTYGLDFDEDSEISALIVDELKQLRRAELTKKNQKGENQ